jgi:hypothetical protein
VQVDFQHRQRKTMVKSLSWAWELLDEVAAGDEVVAEPEDEVVVEDEAVIGVLGLVAMDAPHRRRRHRNHVRTSGKPFCPLAQQRLHLWHRLRLHLQQ